MEGPAGYENLLAEWKDEGWVKIKYNPTEITFWNSSKIHLCHCQYEKDKFKYQGPEIHLLLIDELTHFTATIYKYLRARVRLAGLEIPEKYKGKFPRIICGSNPGNIGHNWVKNAFIDYQPEYAIKKTSKKDGGMRRQFIPSLLEDNPTLMENDPEYEERLEGLGVEATVNAMRWGDWDIVAGGMFDDVWKKGIHVIKPFAIPFSWYINRSFDWGSSKPYSVGFWAESDGTEAIMADGTIRTFPRGTLFRTDEMYGWTGEPNVGVKALAAEVAVDIVEREGRMPLKVNDGPADSSIYNEENGMCIADDMEAKGVTWDRANKRPGSRANGWELMRSRLKAATQSPMEDPGLFIFENCLQFIRTIPTLARDPKKTDDILNDSEDHIADEARYRILELVSESSQGKLGGA